MADALSGALRRLVESEFVYLSDVDGETTNVKSPTGGWSQREELGHLIDSAANNHIRFVVATLTNGYQGSTYQQDGWVDLHGYNKLPWTEITGYWRSANRLLVRLVSNIPESALAAKCVVGDGEAVTLQFLIEDYMLHMRHHLDHLLRRPIVTKYPAG